MHFHFRLDRLEVLIPYFCKLWLPIGKEFPLRCDRHDKITLVSKASDFGLVSNGGCGAVCNLEMECGHICPKMCHAVLDTHVSDDCEEPCKRYDFILV